MFIYSLKCNPCSVEKSLLLVKLIAAPCASCDTSEKVHILRERRQKRERESRCYLRAFVPIKKKFVGLLRDSRYLIVASYFGAYN